MTALIHEFDDKWDEALPATLLAMRTSVNRTTGFTPFYLEHGREARLPVDMVAGPPPGQSISLDKYTEKLRNQFVQAFTSRRTTELIYATPKEIVQGKAP